MQSETASFAPAQLRPHSPDTRPEESLSSAGPITVIVCVGSDARNITHVPDTP